MKNTVEKIVLCERGAVQKIYVTLSLAIFGILGLTVLSKWYNAKTESFKEHTLAQIEKVMNEDAPASGEVNIEEIMNENSLKINDTKLVDASGGSFYGLLDKE